MQNSLVDPSGPGLFWWGEELFHYRFNFMICNWSVQLFFLFLIQALEKLYIARNLSISSRLSNLLAYNYIIIILIISQKALHFCGVGCNFFFLILFIQVLSLLFLMSLAKDLSILSLKQPALSFSFFFKSPFHLFGL